MNLYFRCLLILFKIFCSSKSSPADKGHLSLAVLPNDLDLNAHMNNGRYHSIGDLGRLHLMGRMGIFPQLIKKGWKPVIISSFIRFRKPLGPFMRYRLETEIIYMDEKYVYFEHRFVRKGIIYAYSIVKAAIISNKVIVKTANLSSVLGMELSFDSKPKSVGNFDLFVDRPVLF